MQRIAGKCNVDGSFQYFECLKQIRKIDRQSLNCLNRAKGRKYTLGRTTLRTISTFQGKKTQLRNSGLISGRRKSVQSCCRFLLPSIVLFYLTWWSLSIDFCSNFRSRLQSVRFFETLTANSTRMKRISDKGQSNISLNQSCSGNQSKNGMNVWNQRV